MIRYIATRCGYAEGNATGCLVWEISSRAGFQTKDEAMASFIAFITEQYQMGDDDTNPSEFDQSTFEYWYRKLVDEPCHCALFDWDGGKADLWNPWSFPREGVNGEFIGIGEYAESVISEQVINFLEKKNC